MWLKKGGWKWILITAGALLVVAVALVGALWWGFEIAELSGVWHGQIVSDAEQCTV